MTIGYKQKSGTSDDSGLHCTVTAGTYSLEQPNMVLGGCHHKEKREKIGEIYRSQAFAIKMSRERKSVDDAQTQRVYDAPNISWNI